MKESYEKLFSRVSTAYWALFEAAKHSSRGYLTYRTAMRTIRDSPCLTFGRRNTAEDLFAHLSAQGLSRKSPDNRRVYVLRWA